VLPVHGTLDPLPGQTFLPDQFLARGKGNSAVLVVDAYLAHVQAVRAPLDDLLQAAVLVGLLERDVAHAHDGGQGEAPVDLLVEILRQQQGELLLFFEQGLPCRFGNDDGQEQP